MPRQTPKIVLGRIDKLTEIGIALSAERDTQRLLEMILLGAKELTNADCGTTGEIIAFDVKAARLAKPLSSQAAIAPTNRHLIDDLKQLLDSLLQLIATAIDEKSPYTGDNCRRAPMLTMMLADTASRQKDVRLAFMRPSPSPFIS